MESDLTDLSENAGYIFPASLLVVTSAKVEMRRSLALLLPLSDASDGKCSCDCLRPAARRRAWPGARSGLGQRWRWWSFFVAKSALLLIVPASWLGSSIHSLAVYLVGSVYPDGGGRGLMVVSNSVDCVPLSWSIRDQQKRCRVCLRLLSIPIRIGAPGSILLNWSGTEMICSKGHGILYLPDSEAQWLEDDRWSNLDDSWADLFRSE